MGKANSHTF